MCGCVALAVALVQAGNMNFMSSKSSCEGGGKIYSSYSTSLEVFDLPVSHALSNRNLKETKIEQGWPRNPEPVRARRVPLLSIVLIRLTKAALPEAKALMTETTGSSRKSKTKPVCRFYGTKNGRFRLYLILYAFRCLSSNLYLSHQTICSRSCDSNVMIHAALQYHIATLIPPPLSL